MPQLRLGFTRLLAACFAHSMSGDVIFQPHTMAAASLTSILDQYVVRPVHKLPGHVEPQPTLPRQAHQHGGEILTAHCWREGVVQGAGDQGGRELALDKALRARSLSAASVACSTSAHEQHNSASPGRHRAHH